MAPASGHITSAKIGNRHRSGPDPPSGYLSGYRMDSKTVATLLSR